MNQRDEPPSATWLPQDCTLPTAQQPLRVSEFGELLAGVRGVERPAPARLRLELAATPAVAARAAELMTAETRCCAFFTFTLTATGGGLSLTVTVPGARAGVLDALAGRAAAAMAG